MLILGLGWTVQASEYVPEHVLTTEGKYILLDGEPIKLWGFRVASAAMCDTWTQNLIDNMDIHKSYGVNAYIVFYQGSSGGYAWAFTADGKAFNSAYEPLYERLNYPYHGIPGDFGNTAGTGINLRMKRIIEEADKRGMVVIVGVSYRGITKKYPKPRFETLKNACALVARELKDYRNIIIDPINEAIPEEKTQTPPELNELCAIVKANAPNVLVGGGGYKDNVAYAQQPDIELLLVDPGHSVEELKDMFNTLREFDKPIVHVECYGGTGNIYRDYFIDENCPSEHPEYFVDFEHDGNKYRRYFGVCEYEDYFVKGKRTMGKKTYLGAVDFVGETDEQLGILFHIGAWFQGASRTPTQSLLGSWDQKGKWECVFHLGEPNADGTYRAPGVRWLTERIKIYAVK